MNSTTKCRQPLKEVYNKVRSPNTASTSTLMKGQKQSRKSKGATESGFNLQLPNFQLPGKVNDLAVLTDISATFGRCPPEEPINSNVSCLPDGEKSTTPLN